MTIYLSGPITNIDYEAAEVAFIWADSKGARLEKTIAEELGLELIYETHVTETALKLTRK